MNGFLCVLKPPGMTSSDVVVRVRRMLPKGTKVGHAGTLDPEAAGVLPLTQGIKLMKAVSMGVKLEGVWKIVVLLMGITLICTVVSVKTFRWE